MWIGLIVGWILGSAAFYSYLVVTAREPQQGECMECNLTDCSDCPIAQQMITEEVRKAA